MQTKMNAFGSRFGPTPAAVVGLLSLLTGAVGAFEVGPDTGLDATIYADTSVATELPDGQLAIGGDFDRVGELRRRGIAIISATGEPSPAFDADCRGLTVNGTQQRCTIKRIVAGMDGSLIVSGDFSGFGTVARAGLAKLDAVTGAVDPDWNPGIASARPIAVVGNQVLLVHPFGPQRIDSVDLNGRGAPTPGFAPIANTSVKVAHNGSNTLYFADSQFPNTRVRRADLRTGTVDPVWRSRELGYFVELAYDEVSDDLLISGNSPDAPYSAPAWLVRMDASGPSREIPSWQVEHYDLRRIEMVFIAAGFVHVRVQGPLISSPRVRRYALNGTGFHDASYATPTSSYPVLIGVDSGGHALLQYQAAFGVERWLPGDSTLVRLTTTGAVDSGFGLSTRRDATLSHIARAGNGRLVMYGEVSSVNAATVHDMFRLASDYAFDPAWAPNVLWRGSLGGDTLSAMALDNEGRAYVASTYWDDGGGSRPPRLVRVGNAVVIDEDWHPQQYLGDDINPSWEGAVRTLRVDDEHGWLYVGGRFEGMVCGQQRRNLARVSLSTPCTADPDWRPDPDAEVDALAFDALGRLYVGGAFENIGGVPMLALARFDGTALDTAWRPLPPAPGSYHVRHLAIDNDHAFAAVGFAPTGGLESTGLVRFDSITGATDALWQPSPASAIQALLLTESGRLVAVRNGIVGQYGQRFDAIEDYDPAGDGTARARLMLTSGQRLNALVQGKEADSVLVGGYFDRLDGKLRPSVGEIFLESRLIFENSFE